MKETEWAKSIAHKLDNELLKVRVVAGKRLIYANEIVGYVENSASCNVMSYETDILVFEEMNEKEWKPRVVIETKINSITTHDAITYSQKSYTHKSVHPYLRYGIFIGHMEHYPLPGRLFRHGAHFDFMLVWKDYEPKKHEWETLKDILNKEITASQQLEEMIFNSRSKQRMKYYAVHKPLITHSLK